MARRKKKADKYPKELRTAVEEALRREPSLVAKLVGSGRVVQVSIVPSSKSKGRRGGGSGRGRRRRGGGGGAIA